jgi:hypothetical protein
VWGANRIRYPGSPHCKRCALGVGPATGPGEKPGSSHVKVERLMRLAGGGLFSSGVGAAANAISAPPGEYARKGETQRN